MVTREEEEARCLGSLERECQVELLEGWESAHRFSHGGLGLPGRGCVFRMQGVVAAWHSCCGKPSSVFFVVGGVEVLVFRSLRKEEVGVRT